MIDQYPPANGVLTSLIWRKTAAGGETSLSGYDNASQALSYTPGQEQVYLNGILLVRGDDYTATNGTSITGLAALSASDFVQVNCYNNFSVASLPSTSITGEITNSQITSLATSKLTGTIANNQLANSSITINGNAVSLGGSVSLPGDIESVSAGTGLTGGGSSGAVTLSLDTASVISPTIVDAKGDLISATAADTPARLASSGVNGEVLTIDTSTATGLKWAAAAAGGFTLLSTTTLSGSSTDITSINQNYTHLYIQMENAGIQTSDGAIQMELNSASGNQRSVVYSSVDTNPYQISTQIRLTQNRVVSATTTENVAAIWIYNYANTDTYKVLNFTSTWFDNAGGSYVLGWGFGNSTVTSAISSVKFLLSAGTFSGGTIKIYGVK